MDRNFVITHNIFNNAMSLHLTKALKKPFNFGNQAPWLDKP